MPNRQDIQTEALKLLPKVFDKFAELLTQHGTNAKDVLEIAQYLGDRFGFPAGKYSLSKTVQVDSTMNEKQLAEEIDMILEEKSEIESKIKEIDEPKQKKSTESKSEGNEH